MSFNPVQKTEVHFRTHQGGCGFAPTAKQELLLLLAGSLFAGDLFYEGRGERERRFFDLAARVTQEDPEFVSILATYARQVLGLRSGPAALLAHLFWWAPREVALGTAPRVWLRGDEHLETLAYTRAQGWKLKKALKKAVAKRLNSMSPHALLKYHKKGHTFSQRDALILAHPRPRDQAHAMVYEWLVRGKEALPEAQAFVAHLLAERPIWERVLSERGSTPEAWREALPHMGGLALVRNLGNLHRHGLLEVPGVERHVLRRLGNKEEVRRMGLFPHQWLLALLRGEEEGWPGWVLGALAAALESSLPEIPLYGETLILVDVSGSMFTPLSARGEATYALAAAGLGALLYRHAGGRLVGFDDEIHPVDLPPRVPLLSLVKALLAQRARGGTCLGHALRETLPGFSGVRLVIFTDEQVADDAETPLRAWVRQGKDRRAYVVNVAGYAPLAFPEGGIHRLAGFSDRLLEVLLLLEAKEAADWMRKRVEGDWATTSDVEEEEA
ncbi:60 kDa SS-A/Ro ribonucleoprotein [Meiothermus luteus]|uniref:60 kDa SS-A/Ro ribonucleoprotein n=1 Tax=Meiothermus luteus TaxID=2026184 RepID=A0A399EGZ7_9DEIN|nr:TROVE domain-containing protein [Meiothermus luteus]RIH81542.1 60 kDa SS-A/Ro ribonucleoprotein [Meiothermus luteus]RMH55862.1 MAG: TROVE domain-containing protein [Deinococcota bacterium]